MVKNPFWSGIESNDFHFIRQFTVSKRENFDVYCDFNTKVFIFGFKKILSSLKEEKKRKEGKKINNFMYFMSSTGPTQCLRYIPSFLSLN